MDRLSTPQPFLTEEQRAAFDAALEAKQKSQGAEGRTLRSPGTRTGQGETSKAKGDVNHDRHRSRTGRSGKSKKGGGGGKYTWGSALAQPDDALHSIDPNDPNFNSDDECNPVLLQFNHEDELLAYKQTVKEIIFEFFASGDIPEALMALQETGYPGLHHYFVKKLVTTALDRRDRDRELACVLLSSLFGEVIDMEQMQKGFNSIVDSLDDVILDVPDAVHLIAIFIERAIVDDILPPAFVQHIGGPIREKCQALGAPHGAERVARSWGAGAGLRVDQTKQAISNLLQEYKSSHDVKEAESRLRFLAVPFFHHELVKQALILAMDEASVESAILDLFRYLNDTGTVSLSQMVKGFQRVIDKLEDATLDNPKAPLKLQELYQIAIKRGWVDSALISLPDERFKSCLVNGQTHSVQAFKEAAIATVKEYYSSGDSEEVDRRLTELAEPGLHNIFIKHLIQLAMDRKDREREMASSLIRYLCPNAVNIDEVKLGFTKLLASVEDLCLDMPDAARLLSLFLGRAIVDEVVPPAFLSAVLSALENDSLGVSVVEACAKMLQARHGAERLQNCWHGGLQTLDSLKSNVQVSGACRGEDILSTYVSDDSFSTTHYLNCIHRTILEHSELLSALFSVFT
eukprot:jgi/Botrbrau1/2052/Bobra.0047s0026.2